MLNVKNGIVLAYGHRLVVDTKKPFLKISDPTVVRRTDEYCVRSPEAVSSSQSKQYFVPLLNNHVGTLFRNNGCHSLYRIKDTIINRSVIDGLFKIISSRVGCRDHLIIAINYLVNSYEFDCVISDLPRVLTRNILLPVSTPLNSHIKSKPLILLKTDTKLAQQMKDVLIKNNITDVLATTLFCFSKR